MTRATADAQTERLVPCAVIVMRSCHGELSALAVQIRRFFRQKFGLEMGMNYFEGLLPSPRARDFFIHWNAHCFEKDTYLASS